MSTSSNVRTGWRIVVADEDIAVAAFMIRILREDGHVVLHAYDALAAAELALALDPCDLLISDTRIDGVAAIDLIRSVREQRPHQPVIYTANIGRSTPYIERQLPEDVPILREPFSSDELRATVNALLSPKLGNARDHHGS